MADARCFSSANRWTIWNSSSEALNSRESFCWVYFWEGYTDGRQYALLCFCSLHPVIVSPCLQGDWPGLSKKNMWCIR